MEAEIEIIPIDSHKEEELFRMAIDSHSNPLPVIHLTDEPLSIS